MAIIFNVTLARCDEPSCSAYIAIQGPRTGDVLVEVHLERNHNWQVIDIGETQRKHYCKKHHKPLDSEGKVIESSGVEPKVLNVLEKGKGW